MKNVYIKCVYFTILIFWGITASAKVILPGMIDDFENGNTNSWTNVSSNSIKNGSRASPALGPKNLANEDESNRFLQVTSNGQGEESRSRDAGSRMVFFNENQWLGDYSNIGSISMNVKADSATEDYLFMRLAIYDDKSSGTYSRYVSSEAQQLKTDGEWHQISLSLLADDLTLFRGEEPLANVLENVSHLRFLSNKEDGRAWGVDKISASLSVDNITANGVVDNVSAVPVPAAIWFMFSGIIALFGVSRQRVEK
jgi:hypothetical protein